MLFGGLMHSKMADDTASLEAMDKSSDSISEDSSLSNKGKRRVYGLCLMTLAGFYVVLANTLVQLIHEYSTTEISSLTILFSRSVVTVFSCVIFMLIARTNPIPSTRETFILTVLGLTGVGAILFMYLALSIIPVGDVTVINFTAPIFTSALSVAFLGESCTFIDTFLGFIGFCGVFIMTRPTIIFGKQDSGSEVLGECVIGGENHYVTSGSDYIYGVVYTLIGAFLIALFYIMNKLASQKGDVILKIFYTGAIGVISPAFIMWITKRPYEFSDQWEIWLLLLFIGVLSVIHLLFVAESLQFEEAGPAALIRNADCVYAFILQYLVLGIIPNALTILGATIVVISSTAMGFCRYISAKKK